MSTKTRAKGEKNTKGNGYEADVEASKRIAFLDKNSELLNLEQLTMIGKIPFPRQANNLLTLEEARAVLEKSHLGLEAVKQRVLEWLAVQRRVGANCSTNLLIVSPPGCGKTTIARSIAECLGKPFFVKSMPSVIAGWEITGSRVGWKNAAPGMVIDALVATNSMLPVILLDEIDKMSNGGDHSSVSSAMLQLLDTNKTCFKDEFITMPLDISNVTFIATANSLENIDSTLADRFEIIEIPPYTYQEKRAILQEYIIPRKRKQYRINLNRYGFHNGFIDKIVSVCTEAGVRSLERAADNIYRRVVFFEEIGEAKGKFIDDEFIMSCIAGVSAKTREFSIGF